jgi:hypothetical protein
MTHPDSERECCPDCGELYDFNGFCRCDEDWFFDVGQGEAES